MVLLALLLSTALLHPFTVRDMVKLKRFSGYAVSADGSRVLYTYTEYEDGSDTAKSVPLQLIAAGNASKAVCTDIVHASNLQFNEEIDTFFFTAPSNGTNSLFSFDSISEKCEKLSDLPVDISNVKVSPDGRFVAFSADVFVYNKSSIKQPFTTAVKEQSRLDNLPYKAKVYDRPFVRHWDTEMVPGRYSHLFIGLMPESGEKLQESDCYDVMPHFECEAPIGPFSGPESFTFSGDSSLFAFTTQQGRLPNLHTNDTIYFVSIEEVTAKANRGDHQVTCATCFTDARSGSPQFDPEDSSILYYTGMDEAISESDHMRLRRLHLDSDGSVVSHECLTPSFDRSVDSYILALDQGCMFLLCADNASSAVYFLQNPSSNETDRNPKEPVKFFSGGTISDVTFLIDTATFYVVDASYISPAELYSLSFHTHQIEQITHLNTKLLKKVDELQPPDVLITNSSVPGDSLHSFFFHSDAHIKKNGGKCKLILYIHGGPESPWDNAWSYRWNPQVLAQQGYCVLATNFHGSSSFGLNFSKAIRNHWFDIPVADVMVAWNAVLEMKRYKNMIDRSATIAMGASYGGTFINWLMGHVDNITAYITHDGIFDLTASGYDTDEAFFPYREFGGLPMTSPEVFAEYEKWNPSRSAANFTKPCLVIHGGHDYRIHEYHGIALFQVLTMRNLDARLLYFPTQSHWVWQPQESVKWHDEVLAWIAKYMK